VKVTLYDYIRLLNYFHISTCRWSAADLSTTINFNIIQTRRVIRVESWVITSESRVESESYRGWDSSRVASREFTALPVWLIQQQCSTIIFFFMHQLMTLPHYFYFFFSHLSYVFNVNWYYVCMWQVRSVRNKWLIDDYYHKARSYTFQKCACSQYHSE